MRINISVIIPCFNSGIFIEESIESIFNSNNIFTEIVIVNDGSTDDFTLSLLDKLEGEGLKVIHQANRGPATARNIGVRHSTGEYLLFLDSDNKVKPEYLKSAYHVLNCSKEIGVVYAKPFFFGTINSSQARFESHSFNFEALLAGNYIDMCSIVRRKVFLEVGGFDEHRDLIGWEDADLWVRIHQAGWGFHFIDEVLFDYRIREDSLMGSADQEKKDRMLRYFGSKHGYVIHQRYRQYFRVMDQIQKKPFPYFLRIIYYKYIKRQPFIK